MNQPAEQNLNTLQAISQQQDQNLALVMAEVDQQITTAKKYPRSITGCTQAMITLATISTSSAASCNYSIPRGGKTITGPTIRLAEIAANSWGNNKCGSRVIEVNKKEGYVECEGVFHDLETNASTTVRLRKNITDRNGKTYNADMITVTANACSALAKRNAILQAIPRACWGSAVDASLRVVRGDAKTLGERKKAILAELGTFELNSKDVEAFLGIEKVGDITLEHMVDLNGLLQAFKNEEVSIEELRGDTSNSEPKNRLVVDNNRGAVDEQRAARAEELKNAEAAVKSEAEEAAKQAQQESEDPAPKEDDKAEEVSAPEEDKTSVKVDASSSDESSSDEDSEAVEKAKRTMKQIVADLTDAANASDFQGLVQLWDDHLTKMSTSAPSVYNELSSKIQEMRGSFDEG